MPRQPAHPTRSQPEKNPRRDPTAAGQRDASVNRAASHNYFLLEKFEAGVALTGTEVKSVRAGRANLKDAFTRSAFLSSQFSLVTRALSPASQVSTMFRMFRSP